MRMYVVEQSLADDGGRDIVGIFDSKDLAVQYIHKLPSRAQYMITSADLNRETFGYSDRARSIAREVCNEGGVV